MHNHSNTEMVVWLILLILFSLWGAPSECSIILCPINVQVSRIGWLTLRPCWQQIDGDVVVFTGNAACSQGGGRNGVIFTPMCFITSEAFLNKLKKGKAAEADSSLYRLPASVPPDRGNCTTASDIYITKPIWSFWPNLIFQFLFLLLLYSLVLPV